jgi:hypothetical protein
MPFLLLLLQTILCRLLRLLMALFGCYSLIAEYPVPDPLMVSMIKFPANSWSFAQYISPSLSFWYNNVENCLIKAFSFVSFSFSCKVLMSLGLWPPPPNRPCDDNTNKGVNTSFGDKIAEPCPPRFGNRGERDRLNDYFYL